MTLPPDSDLGKALKTLRARVRMTQREVASAVTNRGVALSTVWYSKLEREPDAHPSEELLAAILAALGATHGELIAAAGGAAVDEWSAPVAVGPAPAPPRLAELVDCWERLGEAERARLLALARSLARG